MKTGLTTSVVLHAAVLGFGLVSLSAPEPFEMIDVESLPVDIVPIEELTQIQQGDKKAPMNEKPTPKATEKTETVPDAEKVGENKVDTDKKATPEVTQKQVEAAAMPEAAPQPEPRPVEERPPEPVPAKQPEAAAAPATEAMPEPQPKQDVEPDPVEEAIAAAEPEADPEAVDLPTEAPRPEARPKPPQAQTAKAPEKKETQKPVKEAAKPKSEEKEFDADEVAALLNKEKASGGGAKRSTQTASLGGDRTTGGTKLTQSEMDALRGQVQRCWNIPAGAADAENLRVSVQFRLDPSGALEGSPQIISGGGSSGVERAAAEAARRAVSRCAPYTLPADKYDAWADVIVNFDPSEMF
jgi:colicin import membrane protein